MERGVLDDRYDTINLDGYILVTAHPRRLVDPGFPVEKQATATSALDIPLHQGTSIGPTSLPTQPTPMFPGPWNER